MFMSIISQNWEKMKAFSEEETQILCITLIRFG